MSAGLIPIYVDDTVTYPSFHTIELDKRLLESHILSHFFINLMLPKRLCFEFMDGK